MSPQADYVVSNGTGAAVRSDINGQLAAIVSNNSGATAPSTTYAYMLWADTSTNLLKLRNGANSAWITVGDLTAANLGLAALASPTFTGTVTIPTATISTGAGIPLASAASPAIYFTGDTNTGIYSPGADQFAITTGGTGRLFIDSSGRLGLGTSSPSHALHVVGASTLLANGNADVNQYFYSSGYGHKFEYSTGNISIRTNSADRLTVTYGGNVGIGVTTVSGILHAKAGTNANLVVDNNGGGGGALRISALNDAISANTDFQLQGSKLFFVTGGSEKARLDDSGRFLVGTSSSVAVDSAGTTFNSELQVAGSSASVTIARSIGSGNLFLTRNQTVNNNSSLGFIGFQGGDGTNLIQAASIQGIVDGTPGTNDMPGRLVFSTTADGASSPTERMRITNAGGIKTYTTTADDCLTISSQEAATTSTSLIAGFRSATGVATGTAVFSVTTNGNVYNTNGTYTTLSDQRLKENIIDAGSQWQDIKSIDIRKFNFRQETGNETHTQIGPIAQELEVVCPGLVIEREYKGEEGLTDSDGNPITSVKYVNQSVLFMKAVKALQEAMERIEQLEASNAELQAEVAVLKGA